jgi:hypothetical protein
MLRAAARKSRAESSAQPEPVEPNTEQAEPRAELGGVSSLPPALRPASPDERPEPVASPPVPELGPEPQPDVEPVEAPEVEPVEAPGVEPVEVPEIAPEMPPEREPEMPPEREPEMPPEREPEMPPEREPEMPPEREPEMPPEREPSSEHDQQVVPAAYIPGGYLAPSSVFRDDVTGSRLAGPYPTNAGLDGRANASEAANGPTHPGGDLEARGGPGHGAAAKPAQPGKASMLADLPIDAPADLAGWLVAIGAFFATLSFVLPWAPEQGIVIGGGLDRSYFGRWGLANPSYLVPMLAGLVQLWLSVASGRMPAWLRIGAVPIALGGLYLGLTFAYFTAPFAGGPGVTVLFVGAAALVVGGVFAVRAGRHDPGNPPV